SSAPARIRRISSQTMDPAPFPFSVWHAVRVWRDDPSLLQNGKDNEEISDRSGKGRIGTDATRLQPAATADGRKPGTPSRTDGQGRKRQAGGLHHSLTVMRKKASTELGATRSLRRASSTWTLNTRAAPGIMGTSNSGRVV